MENCKQNRTQSKKFFIHEKVINFYSFFCFLKKVNKFLNVIKLVAFFDKVATPGLILYKNGIIINYIYSPTKCISTFAFYFMF